jgi:formamidopyrimidine-DNA glycosylase
VPELPEVENIRRGLIATVVGRRVEAVDVLSESSLAVPRATLESLVTGYRLIGVARRGKLLVIDLDSGAHLLAHPMMTGQFVVTEHSRTLFAGGHPSRSMLGPMPNATTRVVFALSGERLLFFNDARKFGRIRLLDSESLQADQFLRRLGPEPLEDSFTLARFRSQLHRHRRAPIKAVILNQSVVAGIGNIYADESLHLARLHPARPAGSVTPPGSRRLHHAIKSVLGLAIESGGTSFADYADRARAPAGYLAKARVFRRQGQPCPVCGTPILRIRVAGRATNVCPHCQPASLPVTTARPPCSPNRRGSKRRQTGESAMSRLPEP